jgi:hypothetical protein
MPAPSTSRSLADRLRRLEWTPAGRAAFISALAVALGSLFVATYTLALGDPVPHRIDAGLIGDPTTRSGAVEAVQGVAKGSLVFRPYGSTAAALQAIDLQHVYAALDLTSTQPTLYVASAAGASVARVLERVSVADPRVRVVDTHPLSQGDPNGVDIFYLMLVSTIVGFISVFQVRANAAGLSLRQWSGFVAALAACAGLVLTLVDAGLHRLDVPILETWGILALQIAAVASFASLAAVLFGRWSIVPTWLFFVVLGNSSSGGAVAPPLLPHPFAIISQWLPSGATVEALRNAVYFGRHQHIQPVAVSAGWAVALFALMAGVSHRLDTSPGEPDRRRARERSA